MSSETTASSDFIRVMVNEDTLSGKYGGRVITRFPPEPNGFLHLGHAKSICLNFGLAQEHTGECNLRFDDTNPTKEDVRYTESTMADVRWLGFDLKDNVFYASDYFERLYEFAHQLILSGAAYVDSLNEEQIREYRGTVTDPGRDSPHRNRDVQENVDLFRRMRAGEFEDGAHVLRAKIDMAASNMLMRDPLLYRIRHAHHYRTGDAWCLYPMYDFAHCLSDAIEGITHSLCTLEFKDNRALYDWVLEAVKTKKPRPEQTEFARLELDYAVLHKRQLIRLVEEGFVAGWDDPRMPTIAGLRRRGVPPEAIRSFCDLIGVAKVDSRIDMEKLDFCIRDDLNHRAPRVMCVLKPLRVVIENYPEGDNELLDAPYYPHDVPKDGSRPVPFARELYIERNDFAENPPKGYYRLAPGREVRLRYAYVIKCEEVIRDPVTQEVVELRCSFDPATRGGKAPAGRKVKGTIHWVSAAKSLPATVRLYDRLFNVPNPNNVPDGEDFTRHLNPDSLVAMQEARIEPSVANDAPGSRYQFERHGYFTSDVVDSSPGALVFNRTVSLRDTWKRRDVTEKPVAATRKATVETSPAVKRDAVERVRDRGGDPALAEQFKRYYDAYHLSGDDAEVLTRTWGISRFFEAALAEHDDPPSIANWIVNEVTREARGKPIEDLPFKGAAIGNLVAMIGKGTISGRTAKEVLAEMFRDGEAPDAVVKRLGLEQISDEAALGDIIDRILDDHGDEVAAYRAGKTALQGFFLGRVMKETGGKANPAVVRGVLAAKLHG